MTAIHNLMRYITIACPFIVTLLAVIIDKEAERRRKWLGLGTALLGFLVLFLTKGENWLFWLIPGALAFVYCWQMRGLGKWLVIGWWLMICSVNLSSLLQAAKLPHYAYYGQALLLPGNLAFWTVPPLTIWYLWHNLPLAFDVLRGGNWTETGTPLLVKYRLLAVIVFISLAANIFLFIQETNSKSIINEQADLAQHEMYISLNQLNYLFSDAAGDQLQDWLGNAFNHIRIFNTSAQRLVALHRIHCEIDGPLYFLIFSLSEGLVQAAEQRDQLDSDDIATISYILEALIDAIVGARRGSPHQLSNTYAQAAATIVAKLQDSDLIRFFDLQYTP